MVTVRIRYGKVPEIKDKPYATYWKPIPHGVAIPLKNARFVFQLRSTAGGGASWEASTQDPRYFTLGTYEPSAKGVVIEGWVAWRAHGTYFDFPRLEESQYFRQSYLWGFNPRVAEVAVWGRIRPLQSKAVLYYFSRKVNDYPLEQGSLSIAELPQPLKIEEPEYESVIKDYFNHQLIGGWSRIIAVVRREDTAYALVSTEATEEYGEPGAWVLSPDHLDEALLLPGDISRWWIFRHPIPEDSDGTVD